MDLVFRSKVDLFIGVVLIGAMVVSLYAAAAALHGRTGSGVATALVIALLGAGLPIWLLLTTRYTLTTDTLIVRSGPVHKRIAIVEIRRVVPSRDPRSSPALSLSRLRVEHAGGAVLISPKDQEGFLKALEARQGSRQ